MEITPELLNKRIKDHLDTAEKYRETDREKYLYNKGKARGLIELMRDTFVYEYIMKRINAESNSDNS